jgi:hypothetical protein
MRSHNCIGSVSVDVSAIVLSNVVTASMVPMKKTILGGVPVLCEMKKSRYVVMMAHANPQTVATYALNEHMIIVAPIKGAPMYPAGSTTVLVKKSFFLLTRKIVVPPSWSVSSMDMTRFSVTIAPMACQASWIPTA